MDITRKGWKCDSCNKEYYEGDGGYSAKYTVRIESNTGSFLCLSKDGVYNDICNNCIDAILEILDPAEIQ